MQVEVCCCLHLQREDSFKDPSGRFVSEPKLFGLGVFSYSVAQRSCFKGLSNDKSALLSAVDRNLAGNWPPSFIGSSGDVSRFVDIKDAYKPGTSKNNMLVVHARYLLSFACLTDKPRGAWVILLLTTCSR
jgi:hypothetical protein